MTAKAASQSCHKDPKMRDESRRTSRPEEPNRIPARLPFEKFVKEHKKLLRGEEIDSKDEDVLITATAFVDDISVNSTGKIEKLDELGVKDDALFPPNPGVNITDEQRLRTYLSLHAKSIYCARTGGIDTSKWSSRGACAAFRSVQRKSSVKWNHRRACARQWQF